MVYSAIKLVHIVAAIMSISGFVFRGVGMMRQSGFMSQTWVKVIPHIIDTILLVSAILLAINIQQYPFVNEWLTAKVLALLVYILFGMVAFRFGKTKRQKILFWILAILAFAYIVLVAVTKQVWVFF